MMVEEIMGRIALSIAIGSVWCCIIMFSINKFTETSKK